jgi:hypothetical protein
VKKMGLFATVFQRADGTETYYFNSQLFTMFMCVAIHVIHLLIYRVIHFFFIPRTNARRSAVSADVNASCLSLNYSLRKRLKILPCKLPGTRPLKSLMH